MEEGDVKEVTKSEKDANEVLEEQEPMLDDEANLLQLEKEKDEEIEKVEIVEEEVVEIVEQQ